MKRFALCFLLLAVLPVFAQPPKITLAHFSTCALWKLGLPGVHPCDSQYAIEAVWVMIGSDAPNTTAFRITLRYRLPNSNNVVTQTRFTDRWPGANTTMEFIVIPRGSLVVSVFVETLETGATADLITGV